MPLVHAKCPNCGFNLEVDNAEDAAICPHCGKPYVVEKAINNFSGIESNINSHADFIVRAGMLEKYVGAATEVKIPNIVKIIGSHAFSSCIGLTQVTIPDSVTAIQDHSFSGCTGLTQITIPNSVTSIGDWAFSDCVGLTQITIPNSVTKIGEGAFCHCTELQSVTIPDSVISIADGAWHGSDPTIKAFAYCNKLSVIHASEEWKRSHWRVAKCLESYAPPRPQKSGCYIATAVYGSYDCPQVWTLRRFRDNILARSVVGRAFIHLYYAVSPALVRRFGRAPWFQRFFKRRLDKLVSRLNANGIENSPYHD